FLASRLVIWLVTLFAFLSLPASLREGQPWAAQDSSSRLAYVTHIWSRWDGVKFPLIAQYGYAHPTGQLSPAFYPLYPGVVAVLGRVLLGHYVLAALIVSLAAAAAAACLLYELARRRLGDSVALRAVVFLGVFPYALFLQATYSESVFLALAI